MTMTYRVKSNEVKRYWIVMICIEGFESMMLMYGTQSELWEYVRGTLSHKVHHRYRIASDEEVEMAKKLGMKAYIC